MARKVERKTAAGQPAAEQLATISPNLALTIAGRALVIREYEFFEGLEVAHRAQALIGDMTAMCTGGELRFDRIRRLFGVHHDIVVAISAQAADVEPDWVRGLTKRDDKEAFLSAWFSVNVGFFVHEVIVELREERQRLALNSIGSSSLPASPSPASATSTASPGTPNASSSGSAQH